MAERPGFLIYFDDWRGIRQLDDPATKAAFFDAAFDYAETGELPDFSGLMASTWAPIKGTIDRDADAYQRRVVSGEYAAYCRVEKSERREPLPFEAWRSDRYRSLTIDNDRYQFQLQPEYQLQRQSQTDVQAQSDPQRQFQGESERKVQEGKPPQITDVVMAFPTTAPVTEEEFEEKRKRSIQLLNGQRALCR